MRALGHRPLWPLCARARRTAARKVLGRVLPAQRQVPGKVAQQLDHECEVVWVSDGMANECVDASREYQCPRRIFTASTRAAPSSRLYRLPLCGSNKKSPVTSSKICAAVDSPSALMLAPLSPDAQAEFARPWNGQCLPHLSPPACLPFCAHPPSLPPALFPRPPAFLVPLGPL